MSLFTRSSQIVITCHKRITPYLEQEVAGLGFKIEETFVTGVRLTATINECIKLNLQLRCASQILYSLKKFSARDADMVYKNAKESYATKKIESQVTVRRLFCLSTLIGRCSLFHTVNHQ